MMKQQTRAVILLALCFLSWPARAGGVSLGADRQEELQRLFDQAAETGRRVRLPAGLYRHSGLLTLRGIEVSGVGSDTVIEGTTRDLSALVLTGHGAKLSHVKLTFRSTTRSADIQASEVLVRDAHRFEVSDVSIDGGDCAGILMTDAHQGTVRNNDIRNTLADSLHVTGASSDIVLHDNTTFHSGDDGIAVVSYERDGGKVHGVEAFRNTVIDNVFARGMSVVGGDDVFYHDNMIQCVGEWAGLYIASESVFKTFGVGNVRLKNNLVKTCGGSKIGHGAVTIFSDYNENRHIVAEGNVLADSKGVGVHVIGQRNADIRLKDNVFLRSRGKPVYEEPEAPPVAQSGNVVVGGE